MPHSPLSEADREWLTNAAPSDWQNPKPEGRYNLVVLGGGTAGLVSAAGAAGLGARVALIEKHRLGGDCLNTGCVPSKALLRSARAAAEVRRSAEFGVRVGNVEVDFGAVMARMRRLRAEISHHDAARRFRDLGIDVFLGPGRFTGNDTIEVAGQTLRFARAVIATGGRPDLPKVEGLEPGDCFTSETVFDLAELPRRLLVLGGGPIGCELAQAFRRFGAEVTVVGSAPRLLPREEPEVSDLLKGTFDREAIRLHLGATPLCLRRGADGAKTVELKEGGTVTTDAILAAVGRRANVEGIGLEAAGVEHDSRGVRVNDFLQTTNPRIYAAGDVCGSYQFTHAADAMARVVIRNALFFGRARASRLVIPWCTYTDPEIAHAGLTLQQATEKGIPVATLRVPLTDNDRAVLDGDTEGFVVAHVRKGSDRIVGLTLVSTHAGELLGEVSLAMTKGLGLKALAETVHAYPTTADVLRRLGDAYNRTRLTPTVTGWLRWFLRWRRG